MCDFQAGHAMLQCHACFAWSTVEVKDGELPEKIWAWWQASHRTPCVHMTWGVMTHDDGCVHGEAPGAVTECTLAARY